VLQEKEIICVGDTKPVYDDVRVVVATNANLEKLIENGKFREDLYYRINMIQIMIPPLRHRSEDIPEISEFLVKKLNHDFGRNIASISAQALAALVKYSWPGNVRELENILGRAIINMKPAETVLDFKHLPSLGTNAAGSDGKNVPLPVSTVNKTYAEFFDEWEKALLAGVLSNCGGNKTKAAKILNISIRSLYYKLEKHHLLH
jgi:transcriptional regulator with PAS, ATPase and Fis domain